MSAPRITLWTDPFKMPLRLYIGTFHDRIQKHVNKIQRNSPQTIEITPGALYMLSCMAGRRMPEPIRWAIFDSLCDILNGKLRTLYPEKQDILAATFGELLGVVLLALELEGTDLEVIRLLESQQGNMPDFLVLEATSSGHNIHVLECKGKVEDVQNLNARMLNRLTRKRKKADFDLCYEQQNERSEAVKQIDNMNIGKLKATNRIVFRSLPFSFARQASTKNIVVSSVADGRILWLGDPLLIYPTRRECKGRNISCNTCIKNPSVPVADDSSVANVMSVLYREEIAPESSLEHGLLDFLIRYQTASRAAWSGHEPFFEEALNDFIEHIVVDGIQDFLPTAIFMGITLFETAIFDELVNIHVQESKGRLSLQASNAPEALQAALQETLNTFDRIAQESQKQVEIVVEIAQRGRGETISGQSTNTLPNWSDVDPGLERIIQNSQERSAGTLCVQKTFPEWDDTIYGSVHFEDSHTLIIHLASATQKLPALKKYMEALIIRFRGRRTWNFNWRKEYFSNNAQKKFSLGESWDMFPYPNSRNGFPGITAWLTNDGRAEIIIRLLE